MFIYQETLLMRRFTTNEYGKRKALKKKKKSKEKLKDGK